MTFTLKKRGADLFFSIIGYLIVSYWFLSLIVFDAEPLALFSLIWLGIGLIMIISGWSMESLGYMVKVHPKGMLVILKGKEYSFDWERISFVELKASNLYINAKDHPEIVLPIGDTPPKKKNRLKEAIRSYNKLRN